jgi:hypothetical protein
VDVARTIGKSAAWVSRAERGLLPRIGVADLVVLGAAVGVKVWMTTYPSARVIHDAPQAALLRRFRARVGEGWRWRFEVVVPVPGDQRAADAVIDRPGVRIMVEAFTRLADGQAQLRSLLAKARDLEVSRIVVVVAATRTNRIALAEAQGLLAAEFPLGTRAVLAALAGDRDPGSNGVVVI